MCSIIAESAVYRRLGYASRSHSRKPVNMARPRRAHAGRHIAKLLNEEEVADDFYKTAYGGFGEEEEDKEYEVCSN